MLEEARGKADLSDVEITLETMRNFSRASEDEFTAMLTRLATILTDAGAGHKLRFVATSGAAPADFRMTGSAYLVVRSGFDFWELFPAVSRDNLTPQAWSTSAPVLVLRTDRPGQPQVFFEALGGNAP